MEWACGLRALFSVPVYAAFAESHDFVKRVLGLGGVQSASEHVDDSYIATRPWDEVLAMTAYGALLKSKLRTSTTRTTSSKKFETMIISRA